LTFIEDGNKNYNNNGLINFYKKRLISKIILKIKDIQNLPYNFKIIPQIFNHFENFDIITNESSLFKLSLIIEPREKNLNNKN
jgi:hypothetical protein